MKRRGSIRQNRGATRVALITGAARRIGAAIARELHADGMNVVIHYRGSAGEARALARYAVRTDKRGHVVNVGFLVAPNGSQDGLRLIVNAALLVRS